MSIKNPVFLLIIPLALAILALAGFGFFFKAAVPGSCALLLMFVFRKSLKSLPDIWFIVAAFLFSIAGDWFLSNKGSSFVMFSAGIGLYLLAHVGYLCFALKNGRIHVLFTSVVLAAYLLFFFVKLYPALDDTLLLIAVLLYLLISCISLGAAFGIRLLDVPVPPGHEHGERQAQRPDQAERAAGQQQVDRQVGEREGAVEHVAHLLAQGPGADTLLTGESFVGDLGAAIADPAELPDQARVGLVELEDHVANRAGAGEDVDPAGGHRALDQAAVEPPVEG